MESAWHGNDGTEPGGSTPVQENAPGEGSERTRRFSWGTRDTCRWVIVASIAGLSSALALVVAGGLPFDVPMPTHAVGWVEPTCGLTRGSTAIARGDFGRAFAYNPASFAVMAFGIGGVVRALTGWTTGRWLSLHLRLGRNGWLVLALGLVVLWAYQQTNAEFVISARG